VPVARRAAIKFGIVDAPDGRLKHQREPVPYLGGLAVYLAFLMSLAFTFEFRQDVLGILLAGTVIVLLGLIDDFGVLSPTAKLAGQLIAVFVLIKSGIRIQIAALPEWACLLLTLLWMIGMINAFNLLDVMDGLSAGVGCVAAAFLLAVAVLNGDTTIAFMLAALAGSLLGFLRYNFYPAKIYLGDAGALFLGFMLGALAMEGQYAAMHGLALLTPLLILGVPIFDTLFVVYVRYRRGLPVFLGSPDHMALRLRYWGLTVPQVVALSYAAAMLLGVVALFVMNVSEQVAVGLVSGTVGLGVVATFCLRRIDIGPVPAPGVRRPGDELVDEEGQAQLWS
jgi:UDP-GlcNAc:undecaprenyl-phosphate GlcNAc-1-phosphate transferase